jgi:hypothetical protein
LVANPATTEEVVDPADVQHLDLDFVVAMRPGHAVGRGITDVKPKRHEIDGFGIRNRQDVRNPHKLAGKTQLHYRPIMVVLMVARRPADV